MTKVKLVSQEGETLEIDEEVAVKSTLIKNMIEGTSKLVIYSSLIPNRCWYWGRNPIT